MEAVKTGIGGFDPLFTSGGYPRGNTILVIGGPGSGKSIFSMQFICKGAMEEGETGIYVTFDETPEKMRRHMKAFGWDLGALEEEKKIIIIDAASSRAGEEQRAEHSIQAGLDINNTIYELQKAIE